MTVPAFDQAEFRIVLGGVPFVAPAEKNPNAPSTTDHQVYMMELCEKIGLLPLFAPGGLTGDLEADGLKLFGTILRSGRTYDLLAGVLCREGQQLKRAPAGITQAPTMWDRDQVPETMDLFRYMTGLDATTLRILLAQLVLAFFVTGGPSSGISLSSSPRTRPTPPPSPAAGDAHRKTGGRRRSGSGRR